MGSAGTGVVQALPQMVPRLPSWQGRALLVAPAHHPHQLATRGQDRFPGAVSGRGQAHLDGAVGGHPPSRGSLSSEFPARE